MKRIDFNVVAFLLKNGKMVRRAAWPKDVFVFRQVPATIPKEIVPNMQSLPKDVKDEFEKRFNDSTKNLEAIHYDFQLAMVNSDNIIISYAPTVEDMYSDDWNVL